MSASNENSEQRRADGDESEEGGLTPALLEQVETRVMERLLARLTPGASGSGEGTSSTAAEGESCGMSVSCGGSRSYGILHVVAPEAG